MKIHHSLLLTKFTVIAAHKQLVDAFIYGESSLVPEARVLTCRIVGVTDVKVEVLTAGLVLATVFCRYKWCSLIEVAFKTEQVPQSEKERKMRDEEDKEERIKR